MTGAAGGIFLELGLVVIIAAAAAYFLRLLKQPQLLAYIIAGVLITPVFHLVTDTSLINSMSIIGIAFLLFIVGIEIDLKRLKNVALVSTLGGAIVIIALFLVSYILAVSLGYLGIEAAYIGIMVTFSSTMIVMKLLSDKRQLNTLHGRIAVGILLLEDLVAILALSVLSAVDNLTVALFGVAFLKFAALFAVAYIFSKFIFPRLFKFAAKNQELLLVVSLAVCFSFALAFEYLGFSVAIGAFIAGLALGNLEYNVEIIGKVKSLRDFFALLFFVSLGMGLSLESFRNTLLPSIAFIIFVIIFKPLLIMVVCSIFKYTKKPSFTTAISLSNIGEFSLIIALLGRILGHISEEVFSITVLVTLVSITVTSYYINFDNWFYKILNKPLKMFDLFTTEGLEFIPSDVQPKVILCGYNRIGYSILRDLHAIKKKVLIVDYNPEVINKVVKEGYHSIYGEVTDEEIIQRMNLPHISMLISTIPEISSNLLLIRKVRHSNKRAKILVTGNNIDEALKLYEHGADYVILPHYLGGEHVSKIISKIRKKKLNLHEKKKDHLKSLHDRKKFGHHAH